MNNRAHSLLAILTLALCASASATGLATGDSGPQSGWQPSETRWAPMKPSPSCLDGLRECVGRSGSRSPCSTLAAERDAILHR